MKVKIALLILAVLLIASRLFVIIPTLGFDHMETYRVGIVPVNDGADWVDRGLNILEDRKISMRPLYPAFLADIIYFFGANMYAILFFQILLQILSVMIAYILLKDIGSRMLTVVILSFFSVWRISMLPNMYTEVLAAPLVLIGVSLVIRALAFSSCGNLLTGFFFIGLAQAVRPWDFISLITLPLLPFFIKKSCPKPLLLCAALYAAIFSGYSMDHIASGIFSTQNQASIDKAHHFYGQMAGGMGNNYWMSDVEIKNAMIGNMKGELSNNDAVKLIYNKSFKIALSNPALPLKGAVKSLFYYITGLPEAFKDYHVDMRFFLLFFALFAAATISPLKNYFASLVSSYGGIQKLVFLAIVVLLFFVNQMAVFMGLLAAGFLFLLISGERAVKAFVLLYITGIVSSFFVVGTTGSGRMWISQELLSYMLVSYAVVRIFLGGKSFLPQENASFRFSRNDIKYIVVPFACAFIFFAAIPKVFALTQRYKTVDLNVKITPQFMQDHFGGNGRIISQDEISENILLWPKPTFETMSGQRAYWVLRYRDFKGIYIDKDNGNKDPAMQFSKWYLSTMPFPRVAFDDRNPIIFPYVTKTQLKKFDGREMIIAGRILGRPRALYTHQGFMIIAEYIGYPDDNGSLKWASVKNLAEGK